MTNTKGESKTRIKTFPFDAAETLDSPEAIAEYLTAALESADASFIAKAIGTAARACGMSEIARKSGLSRENLYRSLNGETRTELDTVVRVMRALGVRLTASTSTPKRSRSRRVPAGKLITSTKSKRIRKQRAA
jgi:probable addiction module antidote protein